MATTTIPWGDGSGDNIYFTADAMEGNQEVLVSSDANAGEQRSKTVTFSAQGADPKSLGVIQLGSGGPTPDFDAWVKNGDTHLWIDIVSEYQKEQQIRIRMIGTIDWGDGSAKDNANVTTYTTFTHTYSELGKYRIDLHPTSGTFYLGGASSSYNVMGSRNYQDIYRNVVLYQVEIGTEIINTLSNYSIYYLWGLRRVYVPKTITSLGNYCFSTCYALTEVEFEDSSKVTAATVTAVFHNCYSLQNIHSFASASTTYSAMFQNNYAIMEIIIPAPVTSIAANTFNACYGLKRLMCLPTTAPTVANANAFTNLQNTCVIQVPKGSLSSYQGKQYWSTYSSQMVEAGAITMTLTSVTSSNKVPMADLNGSYTTTLAPDEGKTLGTVTVKMGGTDITSTAYSAGVVTIANVTGNIEITATAS